MPTQSEPAHYTVNQRLKILIKALEMSVRAFSVTLDVPESSTRNYLDKGTKLNSDYLEKIAHHFKAANLYWLITGEGEPLLSPPTENGLPTTNDQNFFRSQVVGTNNGPNNQRQNIHNPSASNQDPELKNQLALAEKEIAHLRTQLEMQAALLASKEETISLLRGSYNRPN